MRQTNIWRRSAVLAVCMVLRLVELTGTLGVGNNLLTVSIRVQSPSQVVCTAPHQRLLIICINANLTLLTPGLTTVYNYLYYITNIYKNLMAVKPFCPTDLPHNF